MSQKVSNITMNPKETVKNLKGPLKTMIPDVNNVIERFKKELLEPVCRVFLCS